jgi:hypothetical protein
MLRSRAKRCALLVSMALFPIAVKAQIAGQIDLPEPVRSAALELNQEKLAQGTEDARLNLVVPRFAGSALRPGTASGILADPEPGQGPQPTAASRYAFPSAGKQFRFWAMNTFGPVPIIANAALAGIDTGREEPPEWDSDGRGKGFAKRWGSGMGVNAINQTTLMLISAATRQDPIYYRCACSGFGPRVGHALKMSFAGRSRSGNMVFSPAKLMGPFAGAMVSRSVWYPDRYDYRDGARAGALSLGLSIAWNVAREFVLPAPKW